MKLAHLKHTKCPECGARIRSETQDGKHTNGMWFETQGFGCGCVIRFVPNFKCEEFYTQCPNSPNMKKREKLRQDAKSAAKRFIAGLNVDEEFKRQLTQGW